MNPLKKAYCRIFQNIFKFALPVLPYRNPKIIGSVRGIPEVLEKRGYNNVLIITDTGIRSLGLTERLEQTLKRNCISYQIYDKTVANPTTVNVDEALHMYLDNAARRSSALAAVPAWTVQKLPQPALPNRTSLWHR